MSQICFIAYEKNLSLGRAWLLNLLEPIVGGILKRLKISDIKDYHESMCSSIVRTGDSPKFFLASSIPYLKFDTLIIKIEWFEAKIDSNCCKEDITKVIISVSDYYWRLANTGIADKNNLKKMQVLSFTHSYNMEMIITATKIKQ